MRKLILLVVACLLMTLLAACALPPHPAFTTTPSATSITSRATVTADSCLPNVKVIPLPPPVTSPAGPTPTLAPQPATKITPMLSSVDEVSPTDVWAVGGVQVVANQQDGTVDVSSAGSLILHYDGRSWSRVSSPTNLLLHGVQMVSSTEGWAVGETYAPSSHGHKPIPTILHYVAGSWTAVSIRPLPGQPWSTGSGSISAISMVSAQEGWAVGAGALYHYSPGGWSIAAQSFGYGNVTAVQMLSAQDGWAVGIANGGGGQILHFQSGLWTSTTATGGSISNFQSLSMASPTDGWAVGYDLVANAGALAHYCNGAWSRIATGVGRHSLYAIRMVSTQEGWAFGSGMWHYANGVWTEQKFPSPRGTVLGISELQGGDGWAVGVTSPQVGSRYPGEPATSYTGLYLLHYQGSGWTPYTQPIH